MIEVSEDEEKDVRSYQMASGKKNSILEIEKPLDRTLWRARCERDY